MFSKNKSFIYYFINAVIIICAVYFLYTKYFAGMLDEIGTGGGSVALLLGVTALIAVIYILKAFRLYIIFLDSRISGIRFLEVYLKTMPVSLAFPLKSGELFKMYCFAVETGSLRLGILGILVERFFDTIPLLVLLILFTMISGGTVIPIVIITSGFLILISALYFSFPSIYSYMNKYCMINIKSEKAVGLLKLLEGVKSLYDILKVLIKDRVALLLIISSFTWLSECCVLTLFAFGLGYGFETDLFLTYINSVFTGETNGYVNIYVGLSAVLFLAVFLIVYAIKYMKKIRRVKA